MLTAGVCGGCRPLGVAPLQQVLGVRVRRPLHHDGHPGGGRLPHHLHDLLPLLHRQLPGASVVVVLKPAVAVVVVGVWLTASLTRCRLCRCLSVLSHQVSPLSGCPLIMCRLCLYLTSHQVSPLSVCPLTRCRLRCSSSTPGGV